MIRRPSHCTLLLSLLILLTPEMRAAQEPDFRQIDRIVEGAIAAQKFPGAVVIAGHNGHIVFHRAYGNRTLLPAPEAMTEDTIFDVASLTKVLATAPAVMQLFEQGKCRLNDPVAEYLPEFAVNGKQDITIRELLTHYSGLPADVSLEDKWAGRGRESAALFPPRPSVRPGRNSAIAILISSPSGPWWRSFLASPSIVTSNDIWHNPWVWRCDFFPRKRGGVVSRPRSTTRASCCEARSMIPLRAAWVGLPDMPAYSAPPAM